MSLTLHCLVPSSAGWKGPSLLLDPDPFFKHNATSSRFGEAKRVSFFAIEILTLHTIQCLKQDTHTHTVAPWSHLSVHHDVGTLVHAHVRIAQQSLRMLR